MLKDLKDEYLFWFLMKCKIILSRRLQSLNGVVGLKWIKNLGRVPL